MDIFQGVILLIIALVAAAFGTRKILAYHWGRAKRDEEQDVRTKTVLITGAGSGVGFESAVEMADRGATVIITGRTVEAANKTVANIRNRTFLGKLVPMKLELGSLESIRVFCQEVKRDVEKIDILINNAGCLIPTSNRQKTTDGFEMHFGVNHLGHFLLTNTLLPLLEKAEAGRIVIVSSVTHRGVKLNFDDLMFERTVIPELTPMDPNPLYMQSKFANVLFARELAKRLKESNVHVYACCPGLVMTNISRNMDLPLYTRLIMPLTGILFKTSNQGCQTVLYCALSEKCKHESGQLYRNCASWSTNERKPYAFPDDMFVPWAKSVYSDDDAERLWTESERLCQMKK